MIKKIFPILALAAFASTLGMGIISPILPLYAENLGATGVWLGIIFSVFAISRTLIVPFVGRLSDLRGRKSILAIGILACTIISLGYTWVGSIAGLIVVRLLHGIGSGLVAPIAQAYVGDLAPDGEEGKWMGYFTAAMSTGFGLGPLLGGIITDHLGMNATFYVMGGINLLAFLGVIVLLPEVARGKTSRISPPPFWKIATSGKIWGLFSVFTGVSASRGINITFLPVLAGIYLGLSPSLVGVLLTIQIVGGSLLQVPSGRLADRFDRKSLVILSAFIALAGMALVPSAGNFWLLLAFGLLFALGDSGVQPATSAMAVEEGRELGMGVTMGMYNMAMGAGMVAGPILAGIAADLLSIDFAFYFAAAVMLISAGIFRQFKRSQSAN